MQAIYTPKAPAAIGPYSQAIRTEGLVFLSGQIPLDPQTMELCSSDINSQIKQVFDNLSAVCIASGGSLKHIAKLTIYLTNLKNFQKVNQIMVDYFTEPYPARVAIGTYALPKDAQIEIEGIMVLNA